MTRKSYRVAAMTIAAQTMLTDTYTASRIADLMWDRHCSMLCHDPIDYARSMRKRKKRGGRKKR